MRALNGPRLGLTAHSHILGYIGDEPNKEGTFMNIVLAGIGTLTLLVLIYLSVTLLKGDG